jgi:hypothetical protein
MQSKSEDADLTALAESLDGAGETFLTERQEEYRDFNGSLQTLASFHGTQAGKDFHAAKIRKMFLALLAARDEARARAEKAEGERDAMEVALRRFGAHALGCNLRVFWVDRVCTCGFHAALPTERGDL